MGWFILYYLIGVVFSVSALYFQGEDLSLADLALIFVFGWSWPLMVFMVLVKHGEDIILIKGRK